MQNAFCKENTFFSDCKRRICKMPPKLFSKATMAAKVETEDDHDDDDSDDDLYLSIYYL